MTSSSTVSSLRVSNPPKSVKLTRWFFVFLFCLTFEGLFSIIVEMIVNVKPLQGKECCVQVTEDEKVSTVKELIFARLNIPANQQRLLYKGKALADGHRLSDYAIGPEAKLNLVIRQTGEKTGALGVGSSSNTQDRVWQIVSSILARHFSPADASKVLEHLIKEYERSIQQLSLDDIERLAGRLLHPNGGSIDSSYMD